MKNSQYRPRLIDKNIQTYLKIFGAILIEGPKWCGKTWTSLNNSKSRIMLGDDRVYETVKFSPDFIFDQEKYNPPVLIDEWQRIPSMWDSVRNECDRRTKRGNFILTGSTSLDTLLEQKKVFHSGIGRIARMKMFTMSLYESGDSTNKISIMDMVKNKRVITKINNPLSINDLAKLIVKGGWPETLDIKDEKVFSIKPKEYLNSLVSSEIKEFGNKSQNKMMMVIKSLARNVSTITSENTILKDIENVARENERTLSLNTLSTYLDMLRRLNILVEDSAFDVNYRSSKKVGKSSKKHLVDPSLACAALNLNSDKLIKDIKTFGFMFESLVARDLRIYANYFGGKLSHFRDNSSGLEIDAILELDEGYGAFQIKLGFAHIQDAIKDLVKFRENVKDKPLFMCVIVGVLDYITYDKANDIYIVPFNCLKPE